MVHKLVYLDLAEPKLHQVLLMFVFKRLISYVNSIKLYICLPVRRRSDYTSVHPFELQPLFPILTDTNRT